MRSQVGCLFARSCRRVLVSDLATAAYSGPAIRRLSYQYQYQHHCCTRRPFHGATHLLQVADDSSQSDTCRSREEVYYCGHEYDDPKPKVSNLNTLHWGDTVFDEEDKPKAKDLYTLHWGDTDTDEEEARFLLETDPDAERKFKQEQRRSETDKVDDNQTKMFGRMFRNLNSLDVKITLEISFMEAVEGCTKTVTFLTEILCRTCGGTGGPRGEEPDCCRPCKGQGKMCHDLDRGYETCSFCGGLGFDLKTLCVSCKGEIIAEATKAVKLDLVPGVDDSETIKVQSEGATSCAGKLGDLYVTIKVKEDLVFRREKSDIHVDATIGLGQAIFGGTVQVPTLMGDVDVKVTPGTQPGQMAVIPGKGIKIKNSECHGDQYVHFNVKIPENWMERQYLIKDCLKDCLKRSREMEKRVTKPKDRLSSLKKKRAKKKY